jgi:hypothetical protein
VAGQAVQARLNRRLGIWESAELSANKAEGDKPEIPFRFVSPLFLLAPRHMSSLSSTPLSRAE